MNLKLNQVKPDKNQPRKTFEEIEGLAETIKNEGMLQPILVDKSYRIIDGERRYRAAQALGMKEVPVIILNVKDDKKRLIWQCIEDIQHKDIPILERDQAWYKLWKQMGKIKYRDFAKYLGISETIIGSALERAQFVPKLQPAGLPSAETITKAVRLPENIRERAIYKMAKEGITENALVNTFVNRLNKASPEEQEEILNTPRTNYSRISDRIIAACKVITENLDATLFLNIPKIEALFLSNALTELKKKLATYNAVEGKIE